MSKDNWPKDLMDMTEDELLAADAAINRHFFEEQRYLDKFRTQAPPEWATEIDEDERFQREMGAREIWGECPYCGTWHKNLSAFCTPQCRKDYIQLVKNEEERDKTRRLMK